MNQESGLLSCAYRWSWNALLSRDARLSFGALKEGREKGTMTASVPQSTSSPQEQVRALSRDI